MADDILQLQLHYEVGPQPGMNVLHFQMVTSAPDPDPDSIAFSCIGGFVTTLESLWMACLPEDVLLLGYRCRRVAPGGGPSVTVLANGIAGTRTGKFSAGSVGPCAVTAYQKLAGGWAAGRIFLPGVSEDDIEENKFSDPLLAALDDLYEQMLDSPTFTGNPNGASYEYGIYSRTHNSFSGAETMTTSGRPGTQRGRLKPSF